MSTTRDGRSLNKIGEGTRFGAGCGLLLGCALTLTGDVPTIVAVVVVGVTEVAIAVWRTLRWR